MGTGHLALKFFNDTATTEIYTRADAKMKRKALKTATIPAMDISPMSWTEDSDLMGWLTQLGTRAL